MMLIRKFQLQTPSPSLRFLRTVSVGFFRLLIELLEAFALTVTSIDQYVVTAVSGL